MSLRRSLTKAAPYCAILFAAAVAAFGLRLQRERLRTAAFVYWRHRMDSSADVTRASVQSWLDGLQQDNHFLAQQAAKTPALLRPSDRSPKDEQAISEMVTEFATESKYRGIWVLRADGTLVASSEQADSMPDAVRTAARTAARTGERQTVGPIRIHDDEQLFAVIEPVIHDGRGRAPRLLGAVALSVDPYTTLFPTVLLEQDGIEHARHRLVQRIGNEVVVLTPSAVPRAAPGQIRIPWSRTTSSDALAASAQDSSGSLIGIDGAPIIAATRHIPETGWGIVRAIDEGEAYAEADREFELDELIVAMLFLLALVIAMAIRRRQHAVRLVAIAESDARYKEERARLAQRNALLLESAAEGIFGLDREGAIIFINPAAERIVGWKSGELLGRSQHELTHHTRIDGTPNPREYCAICMTASTGRGYASPDDIFWRPDGTSFPVEYQSTPIREGGTVVGAVVTFRDVSARLRANHELVRAKEEAEAANAAKSDFLARMSHELRTPLNSVIGFSNILRKNKAGNLNAQDLGYLERIGTNGVQLLTLINDILDLSKIEAGKVSLDITSVNVGQLVEETLGQLGDRRYKEGVSVEFVVPASLGTIDTDATKLRQVLINLIGNAVKFTHAGTVTVVVECSELTRQPARIRVTDTGIGIAPDRISAIFAAFEQADTSTSREFGGTGLGLSISRALCELLGFRLEVESTLGRGTTFTIELSSVPGGRAIAEPIGSASDRFLHVDTSSEEIGGAPLVLVIEDDADARELLRAHVEDFGYRVAVAASGVEGLRLADALRPHLITLDLMMPGMDGWELLKRLAANPELARIPVVIVSSIAGEMQNSFVGAVDWIDKPVAHALLCDAIRNNIDRREGGVLIVEDDADARELLSRYVAEERSGNLRVACDGHAALAMLERHMPDLVLLDLKMPSVDGFTFLETIRESPRLRHLAVIVVTALQLSPQQRELLADRTIAVLEKGQTLESDLARVMRRLPRAIAPELAVF
jgi:PAS domain S-box-containing protein